MTQVAQERLEPCPFCGGEAILLKDHKRLGVYVACQSCHACTVTNSRPDAMVAWNRRASQAPTHVSEAMVEAAAKAIADEFDLQFDGADNGTFQMLLDAGKSALTAALAVDRPAVAVPVGEPVTFKRWSMEKLVGSTTLTPCVREDGEWVKYADVAALLAAAPAPQAGDGAWQTMDTLELTDMRTVILCVPSMPGVPRIVGEAVWRQHDDGSGGDWWWAGSGPGDYYASPLSETNLPPTHWQDLPEPPALQQQGTRR